MKKTTSPLMQRLLRTGIFLSLASLAKSLPNQNYLCYANNGSFTADQTYGATLDALLGTINTTTLTYGLFNASASRPRDPDDVEAYGVCSGDLAWDACVDCLKNTSQWVRQLCPIEKQATLFADKYWIRYSNDRMYGVVNSDPYLKWYDGQNVTDPDKFVTELKTLLDSLRDEAASGGWIRKYAASNVSVDLYTLYGMVQCSPDLSNRSCSHCLEYITGLLNPGWTGGGVWTPSCIVRHCRKTKTWIIIAVSCSCALTFAVAIVVVLFEAKRKRRPLESRRTGDYIDDIPEVESLKFNLDIIMEATENFSDSNKLGQGGFGPVFRGKLPSGLEIAVKRLLHNSVQGELEFKNEILLLVRLQHRNLVRLLGYCFQGVERLLVYEFVPNASLDKFIFDSLKRAILDWDSRYKIILGIARGPLYLHEDSRVRIIHRDLKASTQQVPNRIAVDTWHLHGHFSLKSDVFSFGVLVLEIVSGRRNATRHGNEDVEILISQVWMNWEEGRIQNIVDPQVKSGYSASIVRCIHVGLLCVQQNVANRPTMASVGLMLNSQFGTLPIPEKPAFFINQNTANDGRSGGDVGGRAGNNMSTASINEAFITDPYPR